MASLELSIDEDVAVSPVKRTRGLGPLFWAAIAWMIFIFAAAALAGLLLGMKAPGAQMIASVTFIAILLTILIQAPTTKWLGKRLGLLEEK